MLAKRLAGGCKHTLCLPESADDRCRCSLRLQPLSPSSQDVVTVHRKNWLPLVPGPALAMLRMPAGTQAPVADADRYNQDRAWHAAPLTWPSVLELEVLISKLLAIDALATGAYSRSRDKCRTEA